MRYPRRDRRRRQEAPESQDRWVVSYADFITLMFAFFTVLFATSEQNTTKAKQFQESLRQHLVKLGAMGDSGDKVNQGVEYNSPIDAPIKAFPKGSAETQKTQKKVESFLQSNLSSNQLEKLVRDISPDSFGVRITLGGDDLFRRGTVQMRPEVLPVLDKLGQVLKESGRRLIIEAHSDDSTGTKEIYPTSWELSSIQAAKVLRYLAKIHKIETTKMAAMTYGDQRPLPPYNRRIDILVLTEDLPF